MYAWVSCNSLRDVVASGDATRLSVKVVSYIYLHFLYNVQNSFIILVPSFVDPLIMFTSIYIKNEKVKILCYLYVMHRFRAHCYLELQSGHYKKNQ